MVEDTGRESVDVLYFVAHYVSGTALFSHYVAHCRLVLALWGSLCSVAVQYRSVVLALFGILCSVALSHYSIAAVCGALYVPL